jgi:hypothetical protein
MRSDWRETISATTNLSIDLSAGKNSVSSSFKVEKATISEATHATSTLQITAGFKSVDARHQIVAVDGRDARNFNTGIHGRLP